MLLGKVQRLWRYPVKSLLGEDCSSLMLDGRGVQGDRYYAIVNKRGKFGSGKNTRRFRKIDGLFGLQASYENRLPVIRFPDGRVIRGDDPALDQVLSEVLEQQVSLQAEAHISHLDAGPVHILTTSSLRWLASLSPKSFIDERRFRPNILIHTQDTGQIERTWVGRQIKIGDTLLRINKPTERCGMISFAQEELPRDPGLFKIIARQAGRNFGVYAEVLGSGSIHSDDTVSLV